MRRQLLSVLRCPTCGGELTLPLDAGGPVIEESRLTCTSCTADYPVSGGIPRFVPPENYAHNFGVQWNMFDRTQLDSHSGVPISRKRFDGYTGWSDDELAGQVVLDAGSGAGRFAEVALDKGAHVIAVDFSSAIDAARRNLGDRENIDFIQADINALPFAPGTFSHAYCLGVLQHTPDPAESFANLAKAVSPGGQLAVDVYPAGWKNLFFAKYWIRPITRRLSAEQSYRIVEKMFPALYRISQAVGAIPIAGHYLRYLIPVVNYNGVYPLDSRQQREWALLDTFDMWAPAYDQPQTMDTLRGWFEKAGFAAAEVFHSGFFVGRGRQKPAS